MEIMRRWRERGRLLSATVLLLLPTIASAQENAPLFSEEARDRSSRIMPFAAFEFGTPQSIQRAPGVVNRGVFQSDGTGRSIDRTALFGLTFLFPRIVDDAFGVSIDFSLAQSDGWFESNLFLDSVGSVDRVTRNRVTSSNLFRVDTDEAQGRIALLGTWDMPTFRVAAGPWAGYRSSSRLTQIERIEQPADAVFIGTNDTARIVGAGSDITSFRWRFGGAARIERDIYISRTLALVPQITTRFDGESLFSKGLGLRAFSIGLGLGFSVAWRPDPIAGLEELLAESRTPPPPVLSIESRGYAVEPRASIGDTIIIREERHRETDMVAIPTRWPAVAEESAAREGSFLIESDEELARRQLDEVLGRLPSVLMRRLHGSELTLILTPEGDDPGEIATARIAAERLRATMVAGGLAPEQITIDTGRQRLGNGPMLHLTPSRPELLDPLLLQRNVVTLRAPDLAIRREGAVDTGSGWSMIVRQDGALIGAGSVDMEGAFSIERTSLRESGGVVTVATIREENGEIIEGGIDTLFYQFREIDGGRLHRWVLPGEEAANRQGTVYRAFLKLAGSAMRSTPESAVEVLVSRSGTIGREQVITDLLAAAGEEYHGTISSRVLAEENALEISGWGTGIIIVLRTPQQPG